MKKLNINVNKIKTWSFSKLSILFAWSKIQWNLLDKWIDVQQDLFFEWLGEHIDSLVDELLECVYNIPFFLRNLLYVLFYYKKAFFYYRFDIVKPILKKIFLVLCQVFNKIRIVIGKILVVLNTLKKILEKKLKRQWMFVYKQWMFVYNHVVTETATEAFIIEKKNELLKQRQKAPSLWVLKLDFLAFFSILNRIFSVLLIVFVFLFVAFIFIYNLKFKTTSIIMFYIFSCTCTILFIHIGFSYFKFALLLDNFRNLVSNNISNIKIFYIIIYIVLFLISLYYLIVNIVLGHELQTLYFILKALYFNYNFDQLLIFEYPAEIILKKFTIYFSIVFFTIVGLAKYVYICRLIVNCDNFFNIAVHCVCCCFTFIFVIKLYCKHNVHKALYAYTDIITLVSCNGPHNNNVTRRIIFDPYFPKQFKGFVELINSVSDITYPIIYREFYLSDGTFVCSKNQFARLMEDVYLYIGMRTYKLIYLSFQKPDLFNLSCINTK